MSLCKECVSGVRHEGTPEGKWEKIGGVDTYVATPATDYPKDKVILYLADVFGPQLSNAQLLADDFARNGFKTIVPDILNGDPVPPDAMEKGKFDLQAWFPTHLQEHTRPTIDNVIAALEAEGVTSIGATGFCFGARYVFDLAFDGKIKVGVVSHPSLLKVPEDFERYAQTNVPLLMNTNPEDPQLSAENRAIAVGILGGGKFAPGFKHVYYDGCGHGFAIRGDLSNPVHKSAKESAFKDSVEWFINKL